MDRTVSVCGDDFTVEHLLDHKKRAPSRWQLLTEIARINNNLWTDDELKVYDVARKTSEGPGEKSIRMRLGLPLDEASSQEYDIICPGHEFHHSEIKAVARLNENKKIVMQPIDINKPSAVVLGKAKRLIARAFRDSDLGEDAWRKIDSGEISKRFLEELHPEIATFLRSSFVPPATMKKYKNVICTFPLGFIVVPPADYASAFEFHSVSRNKTKYNLTKRYLVLKLLELVQQRDEAPKLRQHLNDKQLCLFQARESAPLHKKCECGSTQHESVDVIGYYGHVIRACPYHTMGSN